MNVDLITADQWRMARAALATSRADIGLKAGVTADAVAIAETDPSRLKIAMLETLERYYRAKGVSFVRDAGRVGALLRQRG